MSRLRLGRRSRKIRFVAAAALVLSLAGCSSVGRLFTPAPVAYDLAAATRFPRHPGPARGQLVIAEPSVLGPLDGTAVVIRPAPGEAARLTDVQWVDRLPRLVQARLIQSFENARRLRGVGSPGDGLAADFVLQSELHAFEMSVTDSAAVIEIAAKIVDERSGRVAAARVFHVVVPAETVQGPGAIAALNAAFVKAASELVLWAARVV